MSPQPVIATPSPAIQLATSSASLYAGAVVGVESSRMPTSRSSVTGSYPSRKLCVTPETWRPLGSASATQIAAGDDHACALLSTGGVDCWGDNGGGDLGNGSTTSSSSPVVVQGIINATQITAGGKHSCAVLSTSGVDCWGYDEYGELGDGHTEDYRTIPVAVQGLP